MWFKSVITILKYSDYDLDIEAIDLDNPKRKIKVDDPTFLKAYYIISLLRTRHIQKIECLTSDSMELIDRQFKLLQELHELEFKDLVFHDMETNFNALLTTNSPTYPKDHPKAFSFPKGDIYIPTRLKLRRLMSKCLEKIKKVLTK